MCQFWTSSINRLRGNIAQAKLAFLGSLFVEFHSFLEQCKENIVLGHRSCEHMHSLISSLKGIINAFLNGQLVSQETEFFDFLYIKLVKMPFYKQGSGLRHW